MGKGRRRSISPHDSSSFPLQDLSQPTVPPPAHLSSSSNPNPGLSPILNLPSLPSQQATVSPRPEFAELLTPAKLLKHRRQQRRQLHDAPEVVLPPPIAGPSSGGWFTADGDIYRGADNDPTIPTNQGGEDNDDAITFASSSSGSSGSTWSIVSDLERGRKRTVAAIERIGERLGVRRGSSTSSTSVDSSRLDQINELRRNQSINRSRRMSVGKRLTRTLTRRSSDASTNTELLPRRQIIPRRREFMLLLPEYTQEGYRQTDRIISTPKLDEVLEHIKILRIRSGMRLENFSTPHNSRHPSSNVLGSGHASKRPNSRRFQSTQSAISHGKSGKHPTFAAPPIPLSNLRPLQRPPLNSTLSSDGTVLKPKSVADLLHLKSPSSSPDLTRLQSFPSNPVPSPAPSPALLDPKLKTGAWWLDVSCPTWEDLRDIGELLSLHPLTLEDVLQQDPREKVDMFDKLGYYFIAIRALDETYFKYTPGKSSVVQSINKDRSPTEEDTLNGAGGGKGSPATLDGKGSTGSPDVDVQIEKKKEGRRRGWGMGRAVGKLANRQGERVEIVEDNPGREGLEGVGVGAVNVYLAVFADGIISFHYEDISKHTNRVKERILSQAGSIEHTSDWVAHGLIDSIVDAFFPLIRFVDGEVDDIDSLTVDPSVDPRAPSTSLHKATVGSEGEHQELENGNNNEKQTLPPSSDINSPPFDGIETPRNGVDGDVEKWQDTSPGSMKHLYPPNTVKSSSSALKPRHTLKLSSLPARLSIFRSNQTLSKDRSSFKLQLYRCFHYLIYIRLFFLPVSSAKKIRQRPPKQTYDRMFMLRRITDTRKLVTGLTRLLGTKNQVVGRMRKRAKEGRNNVEAYIGDVEDHILLLQTSLLHYEYILAHCQPAYLSQLHVSFHYTRGSISTQVLSLSVITISVLAMQFFIGIFSMNVRIPRDGDADHLDEDGNPAGFNWFTGIFVWVFFVSCIMVTVVRWWRWLARRKWAEIRGVEVPGRWDGYWGWR